MPNDTTNVPLESLQVQVGAQVTLPPFATPSVIDGHDARSCPECGRTFRMKTAFGGKTIRCRGCKASFRVRATDAAPAASSRPETPPAAVTAPPSPLPSRSFNPPPPPKPPTPVATRPPTIFEDIGDVLDELRPGEEVASVVRPRNMVRQSVAADGPLGMLIAVVLGGLCAIPIALTLLRFISPEQFERVTQMLPDFLIPWRR